MQRVVRPVDALRGNTVFGLKDGCVLGTGSCLFVQRGVMPGERSLSPAVFFRLVIRGLLFAMAVQLSITVCFKVLSLLSAQETDKRPVIGHVGLNLLAWTP